MRQHTIGDVVEMPRDHCLACKHKFNRALGIDGEGPPDSGDITICIACGHIMAFADDLKVRELTAGEMIEIAGDRRIIDAQEARAKAHESAGRGA
jgi:hypothetical protein